VRFRVFYRASDKKDVIMSKNIVLAILTAVLLYGLGCEPDKASAAKPAQAQPAVEQQPAVTAATIESSKAEVKTEPVKVEKPVQPEPNKPAAPPAVQPEKPGELTPQTATEPVAVKPQTISSNASKTATQLYEKCDAILKKHVNTEGMVDYRTLSHKKMEMGKLLDEFKKLDRKDYNSWSNDEKLAFWINAYNVELIKIILDNYPIESNRMMRLFWPPNSIRHINGIWEEKKFIIMEEEFTLRAIDQRYFQNEFGDPRVFIAISYASVSGAPLRNGAYSGQNLSAQLDEQVKIFLAFQNAMRINRETQTVSISSIFNPTWYGGQFVPKYGTDLKFKEQEPSVRAVLNFLSKYISPQDITYLETGNYKVDYIRYDWTLNEIGG
jgi:hypothetical protein